ncbi:MAG: GNAT family N-acetyltransferase [Bacteroidales bacterium]|nr:GNAT family N-acetyltransferase [Bacteroidales bacterium]
MEEIIDPVDVSLLKAELTPEKKLGNTNKGGNELYVVTWKDSPNTVREIGRLREVSYREAGASSGKALDLDEYDTMEVPYNQLIVWDPEAEAIIGGYRYILGNDVSLKDDGQPNITSSHLYRFSDDFIRKYLPHVMELGRSFVAPDYQSSKSGAKSLFTMDNLWDGIASVILKHPGTLYFLGKMTIYPTYDKTSRNLIIHFLKKHFNDADGLVRPKKEIRITDNAKLMDLVLREDDVRKDYRLLKEAVRKLGTNIPPLVNSYINSSSSMRMFGSCVNDELGDAIETGIMIGFDDIYSDKKDRHMEAFIINQINNLRKRFPNLSQSAEAKFREHIEKSRIKSMQRFHKKVGAVGASPDVEFL